MVQTELSPGLPLLDYIRYEAQQKGTKIGCREGDCGACTVLIGRLKGEQIDYYSATSCITPLANVHGKHVVTVEGLNIDGLNQVQEAMVAHSGTQCGFCTPGFVTSLSGFALTCKSANVDQAFSAIDGNICRCTGYKSIERAATQIVEVLQAKDHSDPINWLIENRFIPAYFSAIPDRLSTIPLSRETGGEKPIGGGTDLFVQQHDKMLDASLQFLFDKEGLVGVQSKGHTCTIKASSTATDLITNQVLLDQIPRWYDFMKLVSSTPIRNIGTIAGNLVNASPIGDFSILLSGMNAHIVLEDSNGSLRELPLKDFFLGYKKIAKTADEIITEIKFDIPNSDTGFNFEKVCKRKYLDIATVNSAASIRVNTSGVVTHIHCAVGGVGPIPIYLKKTCAYMTGKLLNTTLIKESIQVMMTEISPISDARGSADYKRLLARQLFCCHFSKLYPQTIKFEDLI